MLIYTILKAFAWIWGIAIIFVIIVDMVGLVNLLLKGHHVNPSRYILGTLKSLPLAPLIYVYLLDCVISGIGDYYRYIMDNTD